MRITFTDPPVASLGQKKTGAIEGRALLDNRNDNGLEEQGMVKLYASSEGRLTGAEMMAPAADHLAHLLQLAIQQQLSANQLLDLPFYPASLEAGLRDAFTEIAGKH
nr:hypothetical protein [Methylomarinum sp. Ch1-1]MDP4519167.1 hypothetical protein [Methylomarinum sp. Ch1-1]